MEKTKEYWKWFLQTSMIVGMPVTLMIVIIGAQSFFFTGSCYTIGAYCEYALGSDRTADAIQAMLDSNPGKDMVMVPRGRK